jgi:hypothetical protein
MLEALDASELAQRNLLQSGSKVHASTEVSHSLPQPRAGKISAFSVAWRESHRTLSCSSLQCCCPSNLGGPAVRRRRFGRTCLPTCMILMTAVRYPAPVVAARHTLSGWEECADASLFALLRDKLKSGKTEQAFELKDTQRLKKHLQQVGHARSSKLSPCCVCFAPRAQARRPRAGHRPAHREPVGCAVMLSVLPRLFLAAQ